MTKHKRSRSVIWVGYVAGLWALGIMSLVVYKLQLQFTNAYMGYLSIDLNLTYVSMAALLIIILGFLMPRQLERPSDFFMILYPIFVMLSSALFAAAAIQSGILSTLFRFAISLVPLVAVSLASKIDWKLVIPLTLRWETLMAILFTIALSGVGFALLNSTGGFSIMEAYERRAIGRDIFKAGSLAAYLNVMTMNGIVPFIAFLGGLMNRKSYTVLAIGFSVVFFYSVGVKAPIAFAALAFVIGAGVRTQNLSILFKIIILLTTLLFAGFLIEYFTYGRSEIGEYFFRRVYVIPGFSIQRYMDLMYGSGSAMWSPFTGIESDLPVTYLVGATYFGNVQENVNTNAFTYALADSGYVAYWLVVFAIAAFFKILDALYEGSANAGYVYIGFLSTILLTEQAATTAFLSSGVGLLFMLVVLSGSGRNSNNTTVGFLPNLNQTVHS